MLIHEKDRLYVSYRIFLMHFMEYGTWIFFRTYNSGTCLHTDTLATLSLNLAAATYPLLLMVITYLMTVAYSNNFRPLVILMKFLTVLAFFKSNCNIRTSNIDSFVTFTLLSNIKILSYPKISLLPVLLQINTIAYFVKVKISDFQTRFHDE